MDNAVTHHQPTNAQAAPEQQSISWPFLLFSTMPHRVGHPFGPSGPAVLFLSPPSSLSTPSPSLAGHDKELESPCIWVSAALQLLKHRCVISIILILSPKQHHIIDWEEN